MTGTVEVNGLRLMAHHGVMPQERAIGNIFEVTVHLRYPMSGAMRNDDLDGTLNYAAVIDVIKQTMDTPSALLEHVAYRLHRELTGRFPKIQGGMIKIAKITPPIPVELHDVAVKIEW